MDCQKCQIYILGFCQEFIKLLENRKEYLNGKSYLNQEDKEDILADFIFRITSSVETFEGRNARFSSWAYKVFKHTWSDFFRNIRDYEIKKEADQICVRKKRADEKKSEPVTTDNTFDSVPGEWGYIPTVSRDEKVLDARQCLLELGRIMEQSDPHKCVELMFKHLDWESKGLNQREMAKRYGLSHAAFRKKMSRCRDLMKKKLEACL